MNEERRTLLVVAAEEEARLELARPFRAAGHRVLAAADEVDVASVISGIAVDAILVRGDVALLARVVAMAPSVPALQVGPPRNRGEACSPLSHYIVAERRARATA